MLDTAFYMILNASISACFVIASLLLIRRIRALPRRLMYALWALAWVRLCVPVSISSDWSLLNLTGPLMKRLVALPDSAFMMSNYVGAAERHFPIVYKNESLARVFGASALIWLILATGALLAGVALYAFTRAELRRAVRIRGDVYRCDMLLSPALSGVLRPRILLPPGLDIDSTQAVMVIAHERVHARRLDNLWRMLAIAIACVHWFNPMAWLALKLFLADMEHSCDEAVVRLYDAEGRGAYAGALLRFADESRLPVSAAFGRSRVKLRIAHVLHYRRLSRLGVAASAAFALAVALALLTNPSFRG